MNIRMKNGFTTNQLVSTTEFVRNFSSMRKKAKKAPLLILEQNEPDSVLLSVNDYNQLLMSIEELSEQIFEYKVADRVKELKEKEYDTVSFSEIASPKILNTLKEIEDWEITDEELCNRQVKCYSFR